MCNDEICEAEVEEDFLLDLHAELDGWFTVHEQDSTDFFKYQDMKVNILITCKII